MDGSEDGNEVIASFFNGAKPPRPILENHPAPDPTSVARTLLNYLDIDARTNRVNWGTIDGGRDLRMVRCLADHLASCPPPSGPDPLDVMAEEYMTLDQRLVDITLSQDTRKGALPAWATDDIEAPMMRVVLMLMKAAAEAEKAVIELERPTDEPMRRFVVERFVPDLRGLIETHQALIDEEQEKAGLLAEEREADHICERQGVLEGIIMRTPATTLSGIAAKLQIHLQNRRQQENSDDSPATALLARAVRDLRSIQTAQRERGDR